MLAIIPARGGSKGIPRKNLKSLGGYPLIYHTIKEARLVGCIKEIVVSSEDDEINAYANTQGISIDYIRPQALSKDDTPMADVILDIIEWMESQGKKHNDFILLQPTSPLRTSKNINDAIDEYNRLNSTSLASIHLMREHPYECVKGKGNEWEDLVEKDKVFHRRQDFDNGYYYINGAIYICNVEEFKRNKKFISSSTFMFEMEAANGIDIDEKIDFIFAESLIKNSI